MTNLQKWSSLLLLAFFAVLLLTSCDALNSNRPGLKETNCEGDDCPPKEPVPALSLDSVAGLCDSDTTEGGEIVGVVSGGSPDTKWKVIDDSTGNLLAEGTIGPDTTFSTNVDFDGSYSVSVTDTSQDTTRTAKSGVQLDCETEPLQPGLDYDVDCARNSVLVVVAANGLTSYELVYEETGEVVASESGITPEEDQEFRFPDVDFEDGDYTFNGELNGQDGSLEPSISCSGPGQITIDTTCEDNDGVAIATVENGARNWSLFRNGEKIAGETGLTPEENQTIELGDNLDDGDNYRFEADVNGQSGDREFSIACDGPGAISIDKTCDGQQGTFVVTSENGYDVARVFDTAGNLIDQKQGPQAEFTDLDDGEYTIEVEKNSNTNETEESVSCDPDPPEAPELISQDCSADEYDGVLTYSVDPTADTYELRNSSDEVVKSGDVNDRSEIDFSGLADGEYYLVLFKNDLSAESNTTTVECSLVTEVCEFTFSGLEFVDGYGKALEEPLSNQKKEVLPVEPEKNPRIKMPVLLDQGDEIKESFTLAFIADGDTTYAQIQYDIDDSGSGPQWIDHQWTMSDETLSQLEVGKAYKVALVHGCLLDEDECLGGGQDVVASTEDPTGEEGRTGGWIIIETDTKPNNQ